MSDMDQGTSGAPGQSSVTPAKMDAALKAKWVEALRSGHYRQTTRILEDFTGANCCLGVLARLQGERLEEWSDGDKETSCLPQDLAAGIPFDVMLKLARMNDGGWENETPSSFAEIADYIEANL